MARTRFQITRPEDSPGNAVRNLQLKGGSYRMERGTSIVRALDPEKDARILRQLEVDGYAVTEAPPEPSPETLAGTVGVTHPLPEGELGAPPDTIRPQGPGEPPATGDFIASGEPVPAIGAIESPETPSAPAPTSRRKAAKE